MKWPMLIFSFYLLVLSAMPCFCEDMPAVATTPQVSTAAPSHHEEKENESCNPFCACTCCTVAPYFHQRSFIITQPVLLCTTTPFTIVDQSFLSYNSHSIWQPPKA
jgi:hypothetical protein